MFSVLSFDFFAKANKTHKDNLVEWSIRLKNTECQHFNDHMQCLYKIIKTALFDRFSPNKSLFKMDWGKVEVRKIILENTDAASGLFSLFSPKPCIFGNVWDFKSLDSVFTPEP